jgi:protocatechuate 3,4-dioxygenase alpha subunit
LKAEAEGRYSNSNFEGFSRCDTGVGLDQKFFFNATKLESIGNHQALHLNLTSFIQGIFLTLFTFLYFPDESIANSKDPILLTAQNNRPCSLIAQSKKKETVFFDT